MSPSFHSPAFGDPDRERSAGELGLIVFLASEAMLFGGLIMVYLITRAHYGQAFATGSRELNLWLGTLNTAVLLTSSTTMAIGIEMVGARGKAPVRAFWATAVLGLVFLVIKGLEYGEEVGKGLLPLPGVTLKPLGQDPQQAALFFDLYLALTGLHAVHLLTGIGIVVFLALTARRSPAGVTAARATGIGLYWHFIDVVWVFLFPLLYLLK